MTYKAIGFDWGGVINGKPGGFSWQPMADKVGVTIQRFEEVYFHHNQPFNSGEITQRELWTRVMAELGVSEDSELIDEMFELHGASNAIDLNQDVLDLLTRLRTNGYVLGLLSNNIPSNATLMRELGIDKYFDVFHISCETGLPKPQPAAFTYFAEALGVEMRELIFIDDTPKSLSTADELGYSPVLFTDYEKLAQSLSELGIEIA